MNLDEAAGDIDHLVIHQSTVSAIAGCGYRWYLEKVVGVPRVGAWWFVGGRAFAAFKQDFETQVSYITKSPTSAWPTEEWCRRQYVLRFAEEIEKAVAEGDGDPAEWLRAGGKEDGAWWVQAGADMAGLYRERNPASRGFSTLVLPNGSLGLEVEITAILGERLVQGRIDHLTLDRQGYVDVQDDKSGGSLPQDPFQLELYATVIERTLGVKVARLHYYWARPLPVKSVRKWLVTYQWDSDRQNQVIERVERTAQQAEKPRSLLPVVSNKCKACGVKKHCIFGGTGRELL
jgi:predicted Zn-ribbon and HTH transcriptional regulator